MKTYKYLLGIFGILTLWGIVSCGTGGGSTSNHTGASTKSIPLYYNGASQPNTAAQPTIAAFESWCNESCSPTTQISLSDPINGNTFGSAYVWAKDFVFSSDNQTQCFSEFVEYKLSLGNIYTQGDQGAACGAFMDPTMVKPVSNPQAIVAAAGGSGTIIGGTGIYQNIQGTYNSKLWLEVLNSTVIYYDYIFINLMLE